MPFAEAKSSALDADNPADTKTAVADKTAKHVVAVHGCHLLWIAHRLFSGIASSVTVPVQAPTPRRHVVLQKFHRSHYVGSFQELPWRMASIARALHGLTTFVPYETSGDQLVPLHCTFRTKPPVVRAKYSLVGVVSREGQCIHRPN